MKSHLKFLTLISMLLTTNCFASDECPDNKHALVFVNGMFNDEDDAKEALEALQIRSPGFDRYEIAYNFNEPLLLQLLQVFEQKRIAEAKFQWSFFSRLNGPAWFNQIVAESLKSLSDLDYVSDPDLRDHVSTYLSLIISDFRIVVVAHSQGNFYANQAYELLKGQKRSENLTIVGVASPDSYVAGGGEYRTLKSDNLIRSLPGSLPFNVYNQDHGFFDHSFVPHYLNGSPSGAENLGLIESARDAHYPQIELFPDDLLGSQKYFYRPGYLHKSLLKMNSWMSQFAQSKASSVLPKYQCLAIALFLKVENWSGVSCIERSLNTIRKGARECLEDEWSNPEHTVFSCGLKGLDEWFSSWRSASSESEVLFNHPECTWAPKIISSELNSRVLDQALNFISDPN